ncbi:2-oxo-3-hexenedioate decarboxylase [Arcobacter aquimarinus]|uniref:4-oxalocrotonate decarboxylase n=1 Tax=Arcobacter aquimarinus TaxID=1315211 RepID=A0AAE7B4B0_9BACT|nr:2-oxo-3-hexenedioate decarboxylase [Arcobacter aquimarinus]QKE25740.1 4-oxalocrotonate decarboxylase [Arcobacter aquimarinus]RXI35971.1 2-oxo-3-hexenedioate decarboxylase [Arcobacter aquimarinus]
MSLDKATIEKLAKHCEEAEVNASEITKITDDYPDMTYEDAYDIQWTARKAKEAKGHKIVGMKMGLTSQAKMKQMGVPNPCYGYLADYFAYGDGAEIKIDELIHPKVEAEIAFVLKNDLEGPGCHIGDVLAATDFVMPAVEIIDSRYKDFKFDLKSVIADNSSSSRYVTGGRMRDIKDLDLKTLGVVMEINGEVVQLGAGAAVLGHPATAIAMLANMLSERGEKLKAGEYILSGAITEAVSVKKGDNVTVKFQDLGTLSFRFV